MGEKTDQWGEEEDELTGRGDMRRASQTQSPRGLRQADSRRLLLPGPFPPSLSEGIQILVISSVLASSEPVHPSTPSPWHVSNANFASNVGSKRDSDDNDDKRHPSIIPAAVNAAHLWNSWVRAEL